MKMTIHETDIESNLCQTCGACCRILLKIPSTTPRYRKFLRRLNFNVLPPAEPGQQDCCDANHDVDIDMGYCPHLVVGGSEMSPEYSCSIYNREDYPELCLHYNCVSWAKANDRYDDTNSLLVGAQVALARIRRNRTRGGGSEAVPGTEQDGR